MAQVPYTGVPETSPQFAATPTVHADVPAAAFGAQSAQGLGQMGKGFEHAGNELFTRAIALQQLDQQMKALNANADATDKISDEYAKFSTLEGRAAMAALPDFKKRVQDIHGEIGQGLESDYARKLYMQESRAMQTRVYFSAAKHAGDQFKHYLTGSSQASIESARRTAGVMPDDDGAYDASLKTNAREAKAMGQLKGWSEEQTRNFLDKSNSETVVARTQALAERDPVAAQKVLDAAIKKGIIAGDDAGKMGHYIRAQKNNVMARVESAKFMNGEASTVGSGIVNIEDAKYAIKMNESSGNYNPPHPEVTHRVNGKMITERALGAYGIMQSNLQPWLKEAGMPEMSEKEFLADPKAQDKLFEFKFGQLQRQYGSADKAANVWFTGSPDPAPNRNDGGTTAPAYLAKFRANLLKRTNGSNLEAAAKSRAEQLAPGDVEFAETFTNKVRIQHSHDQQMARQDEYDRQNTMLEAIGPGPDGKLPTSVDEMGPDAREAYMNADVKHRRQIDKLLMQNTRNGYAETPENTRQYQKLMGIANDPLASGDDRKQLLDTDVTTLEMPYKWTQQIAKARMAVFKNTQRNPALGHAIQLLAPAIHAAGLSNKKSDDWYVFQGALHTMMQHHIEAYGKPMNDEEIKKAAGPLLMKTSQPWGPFGILPGSGEAFRADVPEKDAARIKERFTNDNGREPNDKEIKSIYAAMMAEQFNLLHAKKKSLVPESK